MKLRPYDCEGNLACVSNAVSGAVSLYWYDQHGRRVAKSENGLLTLYIWDGMDIIATAHADGTIREYFTRGIGIAGDVGSLVAETRFSGGTATTTYLHSNWRGDVVMAADTSGNVVGEYAYTTFGEQLSSVGSFVPRFTFSSKERDASGLVYHGFRYYSPVLCRWISEDPIREGGGFNLYQFCWNNPVNRMDLYGRNPVGGTLLGWVGYNVVSGALAGGVIGAAGSAIFSNAETTMGIIGDAAIGGIGGASGGAVGGLFTSIPLPGFDILGGIAGSRVSTSVANKLCKTETTDTQRVVANSLGFSTGLISELSGELADSWLLGVSSGVSASLVSIMQQVSDASEQIPDHYQTPF